MSAYKKLKAKESFVTSYTSNKTFNISGSNLDTFGIKPYVGISSSIAFNPSTSTKRFAGTDYEHYLDLTYKSIYHLYYSNFSSSGVPAESYIDGSGSMSGSRHENYLGSSYTVNARVPQDRFTIFSIPRKHFGENILPGSVIVKPASNDLNATYVASNYSSDDYVEDGDEAYGSDTNAGPNFATQNPGLDGKYSSYPGDTWTTASTANGYNPALLDDGNGQLLVSGSNAGGAVGNLVVGNIIYEHGMIIISQPQVANYYADYFTGSISWKTSHPIYTYNYHCTIKESEFNFSQNPTSVKDTSGSLADNITGSYFQPYFTTVGLYNDANELIAVAKMAQPVPISDDTEMTIKVKLDI